MRTQVCRVASQQHCEPYSDGIYCTVIVLVCRRVYRYLFHSSVRSVIEMKKEKVYY